MQDVVKVANQNAVSTERTVLDFIDASTSDNTKKAYRRDWVTFQAFCQSNNVTALPASPETVAEFIKALANKGRKVSTIQRHIASISNAHQLANLETPTQTVLVRKTIKGIKNVLGVAPAAKKAAVVSEIQKMVGTLDDTKAIGVRDRALLLIGFAGAFRRSELVSLDVSDIEVTDEGLTITLHRSKTDQEGAGRKVGIEYGSNRETCPVRSYMKWLDESGITDGAVFRSIDRHGNVKTRMSDKAVALVVKRAAENAGLNPADYAGHSLRSGLATTAAAAGKSERSIMKQTGHKTTQMVRRYIQDGELHRDNASANIGL